MENEEMLEQTNETENVETQTTEEIVDGIDLTDTAEPEKEEEKEEVKKTLRDLLKENPDYQEEYNSMLKFRLDREERKHQKELSKYRDTENVLRTTLKIKDGEDTNEKLREFYAAEGINLPEKITNDFSNEDYEELGERDAEKIISAGYDYAEEEANRLANIGYSNLNAREKASFNRLAEKLTQKKNSDELLKLGAKKELIEDDNFKTFVNKFQRNVPINEIYQMYISSQPKKEVDNPGSMKSKTASTDLKSFYTFDEAARFTAEDYDKHPGLEEIVEKSMQKW